MPRGFANGTLKRGTMNGYGLDIIGGSGYLAIDVINITQVLQQLLVVRQLST